MTTDRSEKIVTVIPARGGSKGLPGKNLRPLMGLPLIAHSILMAKMCPACERIIVSTDDPEIATTAKRYGADVPFLRPAALAGDTIPMWPVVRHALQAVEALDQCSYHYVLLLDPTSPGRLPEDVVGALTRLRATPAADGVVGVSQPEFNPVWHCVVENEGRMQDLFSDGASFARRQDAPTIYRINASLYLWRAQFVREQADDWRRYGHHLLQEIPEARAIHIDDLHEFERTEVLLKNRLVTFPWLI